MYFYVNFKTTVSSFYAAATIIKIKSTTNQLEERRNYMSLKHFSPLISNFVCHEKPIKLLILVTTHPSSFVRRERIRNSWGKKSTDFTLLRLFFVMGYTNNSTEMANVIAEENEYRDIVRGDFTEHFYNLSKKLQTGFEWSYKYCSAQYILKCDDDVFINLKPILRELDDKYVNATKLWLGRTKYNDPVERGGKYKILYEEYEKSFYPPYCSGGAFIFSFDVVRELLKAMEVTTYFKLDDVYLGFVIEVSNYTKPISSELFNNLGLVYETASSCTTQNNVGVYHPVKTYPCFAALHYTWLANEQLDQL